MKTVEIAFEIPEEIRKGLESGIYKRIGGVIVKADGKSEIVTWLKELPNAKYSKGSILVKSTSLGKALLSAADYFYLHENFKKINKKLDNINLKIDAQNLSKIQSGLKLASEAETMIDVTQAKHQILEARSLFEEGSNTLQHILNNIGKKEKNYKEKRMYYLSLIIQAELGIVRSYMWQNEYKLAKMRLLQLKQFLLSKCIKQIDDDLNYHVAWYWTVLALTAGLPYVIYTVIVNEESTGQKLTKELRRLEESNLEIEGKLDALLIKIQENNYKISEEVETLINFDDFLKGYVLELEYYEKEHQKLIEMQ